MLRRGRNTTINGWHRACIAAGLSGVLIAGCGGSSPRTRVADRRSGTASAATAQLAPRIRQLHVLTRRAVPIDGPPLQAGLGAVWSASSSGLIELSGPAGKPRIVVHGPVDDVALSSARVYALSGEQHALVEVDPRTLQVRRRWRIGGEAHSLTVDDHNAYVARATAPAMIERVGLTTGAVRSAVIHGTSGLAQDRSIAIGADKLWVIDGGTLYWLDPSTMSVLGSRSLGASDIWFGDGSLWAASEQPNGGVERIDPRTARIIAHSNADAIQIAFSPRTVWLSAAAGPTAIDPQTARTTAAVAPRQVLSSGDGGIAVVGNQVWTTYTDIKQLQRLLPSR